MKLLIRALCTMLLLSACVTSARAQDCSITAADVAFGAVDPLAGSAVDVASTVRIDCEALLSLGSSVDVCIYLDEGSGGSDGTQFRYMTQGVDALPYNLYKDAARTQIWGSESAFPGSGAQQLVVPLSGVVLGQGSVTVPVYGRVPAAIADRPIGSYVSVFAGGARVRYSFGSGLPCDGITGLQAVDTFTASAAVLETCTVEADDLDFGLHGRLDAEQDAGTQVRTSCSTDLPYAVSLGSGGGGDFFSRRMVHGSVPAETVDYQLYVDAARTQVWGDGNGGTQAPGDTGNGSPQAMPVYGRVPAQPTPRPGDYRDTVVVTVTY